MLNVEEHCWSLAECEARPNQIRPVQFRRSSQATSLWKPVNSQRQRNPAGSGQSERRQRLRAIWLLLSQRHLERGSQGLEGAHGPRNETPSHQQAGHGDDQDQHPLAQKGCAKEMSKRVSSAQATGSPTHHPERATHLSGSTLSSSQPATLPQSLNSKGLRMKVASKR